MAEDGLESCEAGYECAEGAGDAACVLSPLEPCTSDPPGSCENNVVHQAYCSFVGYVGYEEEYPCGELECSVDASGMAFCS